MKTQKPILLTLVLMLALLSACSPVANPAPVPTSVPSSSTEERWQLPDYTPAPTEKPAEPVAVFPTGLFISIKDGAVAYQFNPDGTMAFFFASLKKPVVEGTYKVKGNLLTVEVPNDTDPKCKEEVAYQWFYDGGKLSFAPYGDSKDPCRGRRDSFADTYIHQQ